MTAANRLAGGEYFDELLTLKSYLISFARERKTDEVRL